MRRIFSYLFLLQFAFNVIGFLSPLHAQENAIGQERHFEDFARTIEDSIKAEKANLETYKEQLNQYQLRKQYETSVINGYQLQLSSYENLLLASNVDIFLIQKAGGELRGSMAEIQKKINAIKPILESIAAEKANISQQQVLIKKQLTELRTAQLKNKEIQTLQARVQNYSNVLTEKEKILRKLEQSVSDHFDSMTRLLDAFSDLSKKYESLVEGRKKKNLFERRKGHFSQGYLLLLKEDSERVARQMIDLLKGDFWFNHIGRLWENAGAVMIFLIGIIPFLFLLLGRFRQAIIRVIEQPLITRLGVWHKMALSLIENSLILTGITLIVHIYSYIDVLYISVPAFRTLAYLFWIALLTKWAKQVILLWPKEYDLPSFLADRMLRLITGARYFCWGYLLIYLMTGSTSAFLVLYRLIFEFWFLAWVFFFWKNDLPKRIPGAGKTSSPEWASAKLSGKIICYIVVGAALLMDMVGYGALSLYWLLSWGRSTIVILWWIIFYLLLQEWDHYYRDKNSNERDELLHDKYPLQWLLIRFGQLTWLISLVIVLILAWGGRQSVLTKIYLALGHPLEIGNMSFSVLGIFYAVMVLLITHALTRLWRWIFQSKFLSRSGMEIGLQESITMITSYIIWLFGILVALNVFGLNAATLAVAFGALGIGLGFGLQNIFNNFISGIIMLFERPIQVGDDIEVNNTWATVKKINVRSTVVQTYDNASLIIPNSEIISNQVTNWSFKDKRLRRSVLVGVAYGSDVKLVRETLLEIAKQTPKVLKRPEPDVLFADFGDSALIFKLRIWTDIDNMLKVETGIRFEIDRLFRERNIEISFPQRDIHIRSIVGKDKNGKPDKPIVI